MTNIAKEQVQWQNICELDDILPNMGICALLNSQQIAIFRIIDQAGKEALFAVNNFCPFSESNTLSRGLTGCLNNTIVVASPIYKQHFDLATGQCLEDESVSIQTYDVRLCGSAIQLATSRGL